MKSEHTEWQSDYMDPRVEAEERNMSTAEAIAHIRKARVNLREKRTLAEREERYYKSSRIALKNDDKLMEREIELLQSILDEESETIKGLQ